MKYIWMICLCTAFMCHASDSQEFPEVVKSVTQILCALYDKEGIKVSSDKVPKAKQLNADISEKILLSLLYDRTPQYLQTPEGTFEFSQPDNSPSFLRKKSLEALQEQYTVTDYLGELAHSFGPEMMVYELQRE